MKYLTNILIIVTLIGGFFYLSNNHLWSNGDQLKATHNMEQGVLRSEQEELIENEAKPASSRTTAGGSTNSNWLQLTRQQLQLALDKSDYEMALNIFDQSYDRATSAELATLTTMILAHASIQAGKAKPEAVIQLLGPFAEAYDDLDAWQMLVSALAQSGQWPELLEALKRANRLESDSERYAANLKAMVRAASNLSTELERRNDRLAILNLYQQLYEEYPQHPRFQLELARAHLALNSRTDARPLLQALVYDPNYGSIASQQLELLEQENLADEARAKSEAEQASAEIGQIVVPLIRAGTSFLVDASIEGFSSRLLLDTGASVTALSIDQIQGLGLQATGQAIRLSTANGTTTSRLFRADTLAIGEIVFQNLIVAEIDLPSGGQIDGLLGTDVLRQMSDQYSYLIDDRKNALIFRPR